MLLALSVISANGAGLGPTAYKVFDQHGGSIGRLESNDWSLPDPEKFVSSRHALLSYDGGAFYVEDTSTNGTFINGHDRPVPKTQRMPLTDGDRIFIGDYEILVQLIEDQVPGPAIPAPPGAASAPAPPEPSPSLALGTVDPLAVIGGGYSAPGEDSVHATGREVMSEAGPEGLAVDMVGVGEAPLLAGWGVPPEHAAARRARHTARRLRRGSPNIRPVPDE